MYAFIGPVDEKFQLIDSNAEAYSLVVNVDEPVLYTPDENGKFEVQIPQFGGGCSTVIFFERKSQSPANIKILELVKNDKVTKRLSYNQIAELPLNEEGYRIIETQ